MALPAHVLERLPAELLRQTRIGLATESVSSSLSLSGPGAGEEASEVRAALVDSGEGLPLALGELDAALPDGGLLRGGVVELSVHGASALGTTVALAACRAAQAEARQKGGEAWCAFVDPSKTLYAPGVERSGVERSRLLVVRPELEALSRVALRIAESRVFSVVVIDTVGAPHRPLDVPLGAWARVVRRLSMAVDGSQNTVLLLTDQGAPRPLTLPVAQRIELRRQSERELLLAVAKDRRGRVSAPRRVAWTRPRPIRALEARRAHDVA